MHSSFTTNLILCFDDMADLQNARMDLFSGCIFYGEASKFKKMQLNIPLLINNTTIAAIELGANGVHIKKEAADIKKIKQQYPTLLVGCGEINSKHKAMQLAEQGADYLFFGSLNSEPTAYDKELCLWWSEIMQTPSILGTTENPDKLLNYKADFIAVNKFFAKEHAIGYIKNIN